jgi:hypothetical protein
VKFFLLKMECDLYKKVSRFTSTWKCFCHYRRKDTKKVNNSYCRYKIKTVTSNSFCTKGSPAVHSTLPRTVQLVAFYFVHFTLIFFEDNDVIHIIILREWEELRTEEFGGVQRPTEAVHEPQ